MEVARGDVSKREKKKRVGDQTESYYLWRPILLLFLQLFLLSRFQEKKITAMFETFFLALS
jgi:hypothetical protein